MAAKTGIKQQCPNCEALIPIKDAQIGKRIKCPRCGDPFLVDDVDEAPPEAKGSRPTANGKSTVKSKTSPNRQRDTDDKPALKKKKGDDANTKVIMGVALSAVAVAALGVAAYFVFFNEKPKTQTASSSSQPTPPPPATTPPQANDPTSQAALPTDGANSGATPAGQETPAVGAPGISPSATSVSLSPLSNMLLNNTQAVQNIVMKDVLKNPLGQMAFDHISVTQALGFPVESIEQIMSAKSLSPAWELILVRTNKPVPFDKVKKALRLTPAPESPRAGQDFFLMQTNFSELFESFLPEEYQGTFNRATPVAVRLHDPQTLVFGDVEPLKQFLDLKGQPKIYDVPVATNPAGDQPGQGFPQGGFSGSDQTATVTSNYRTINPRLKSLMDRMETNTPFLISGAADLKPASEDAGALISITGVGFSLHWPGGKERMIAMAAIECRNDEAANQTKQTIDTMITQVSPLALLSKIKIKTGEVKKPGERTEPAQGQPGFPGGGTPSPGGGGKGRPGGGEVPPMPPGGPPGGTPPDQPITPGTPRELPDAMADARITIDLKVSGKNIIGLVDFDLEQKIMNELFDQARPYLTRIHGELLMSTSSPHPLTLGAAAKAYADKDQRFPQGAARRDAAAARFKRPWAPHQRISWMAELLPYIGHDRVYESIDFKRSWSDEANLNTASSLIPQFLAPDAPHRKWYVKYPNVGPEVAATSYVGISGIGLDATSYDPNDPKRGIFSYDRPTRLSEIENLAKTILMIQVPPEQYGPWMAGGGTTVRAVPEAKSIEAFLPPKAKEKRGTHIIMADGAVRYVTESISDDVLKSLAVIKGKKGEVTSLDTIAPVVKPPSETALKSIDAPPTKAAPAAPGGEK